MRQSSDVKSRLPRFKEIMQSVADTEKQGGFEGVSPAILACLEGAEPVGVSAEGEVVLPDGYEPENGPPILAFHPGESAELLRTNATESEAHTVTRIIGQAGLEYAVNASDIAPLSIPPLRGNLQAAIVSSPMRIIFDDPEEDTFIARMPRLMQVSADYPDMNLGQTVAHEADHWEFYLNELGGLQSSPRARLDDDAISTVAERRAYGTTYAIARNLGHHALVDSPTEIAERHRGLLSFRAEKVYEDVSDMTSKAGVSSSISGALIALALSELYGSPDTLVTEDEIQAYWVAGLTS